MIFSENRNGTFRDHAKRREAERRTAHHGFRPAAERKACQRMRRAPSLVSRKRGIKTAAPSPFGAPPRSCAEGPDPRLGSGPRFLESPDPNGRTLSGTSAASTWQSDHAPDGRCPEPPGKGLQAPSGNRTRPIDRLSPVDVPSMGELALCSYNGDICQDLVSAPVTTAFALMSLHAASLVAVCRRHGRRGRTGRRIHVAGAAIAARYARQALLGRAVVAVPIDVVAKSHDAPRLISGRCPAYRNVKTHGHRDSGSGDYQSRNGFHHVDHSVVSPAEE